jgi:zinc transporter 9
MFALSAPISSLVTYLVLTFGDDGSGVVEPSELIARSLQLSICLLFSAGTFLFVATIHVFGEIKGSSESSISWNELAAVGLGILIPLTLSLGGHSHH